MSITTTSDTTLKKSFHRRNDSAELDVFEAARYFAGYSESIQPRRGGRTSFGMPDIIAQQTHVEEKQSTKEKKYKQPSSPGGRLASFLNSLFNQAGSRKKKSKSIKEEEESPSGRRRRSSISHFRISSTTSTSTKSMYSSSSSGFRTPPPYAHKPTKCYKDLRSYSDHKQAKPTNFQTEKLKLNEGYKGKHKSEGFWVDQYPSDERENLKFKKFNDGNDDDTDSDSSSDLFELQNYDLGIYSSGGLPVYETTRMDGIRRGAPISKAAL